MAKMILRNMKGNVKKATKYVQGGEIIGYNKKTGVVYTGFDDLQEKDLDTVADITKIDDPDNIRAFYRKKKSAKPKSKRKSKKKGCGCK
jgi:hypothetical protein